MVQCVHHRMEAVNSLARRLGCTGMLYINVCDMHDAQHVQTEKKS